VPRSGSASRRIINCGEIIDLPTGFPGRVHHASAPCAIFFAAHHVPPKWFGVEVLFSKVNYHRRKSMNECFKGALASFLVSGLLVSAGVGHAADMKDRSFKVAFVQVKEHPHGLGAQKFADLVSEKSGGQMKVRVYGGGTLGGDAQVISSLQGGTVDMTMVSPGLLAGQIKEFVLFDLPFLFNEYKEADAVLDGPVGKKLLDKLPEKGLIGLGYWDHGFRSLTNSKRPVAKLEDIQGLKIRVIQIPIFIDMFNGLGANAVPMPFPELYTALETKTVDGQENPFASIETSKFYEVQKYASTTRHVYNPLVVIFSKKIWDQLSNDERKILADAANEAKVYERKVSREMDVKAIETVKSKGMVVTEISPQETARMREKLKPVTDKYTKEAGEALVNEMYAEIEKVRGGK
jgi:tripartite ATP-independent transporter DctP family solute receptor